MALPSTLATARFSAHRGLGSHLAPRHAAPVFPPANLLLQRPYHHPHPCQPFQSIHSHAARNAAEHASPTTLRSSRTTDVRAALTSRRLAARLEPDRAHLHALGLPHHQRWLYRDRVSLAALHAWTNPKNRSFPPPLKRDRLGAKFNLDVDTTRSALPRTGLPGLWDSVPRACRLVETNHHVAPLPLFPATRAPSASEPRKQLRAAHGGTKAPANQTQRFHHHASQAARAAAGAPPPSPQPPSATSLGALIALWHIFVRHEARTRWWVDSIEESPALSEQQQGQQQQESLPYHMLTDDNARTAGTHKHDDE